MFSAKILTDSVNPSENRLTTVELTYPRCIHSELLTHRMFSRNSASSRAIPVTKMIEQVENNPFIPIHWGKNQKGMQAWEEVDCPLHCEDVWLELRDNAVWDVKELVVCGLHKQIANRLLEPWMWITVIVTGNATAYENFFKLRCHKDAEPHIQKVAYMLRDEYDKSTPQKLLWGGLHLPLIQEEDKQHKLCRNDLKKVSVGRCARVSYLTHDGKRDIQADIDLHDRLKEAGHWSPFEHVATADLGTTKCGNLGQNWRQYRKEFMHECCYKADRN